MANDENKTTIDLPDNYRKRIEEYQDRKGLRSRNPAILMLLDKALTDEGINDESD